MAKKQSTEEPGTEVTQWEDQMAKDARAVAKTERASVNKIAFKSGIMTYMDSALKDNVLDCVVIAHVKENVYYTDRYKADDVKPPACFALALPDEPLHPHEDVPTPLAELCASCEMYQWASDPQGGRGKACKERRRLAVIPLPNSVNEIADSELAVMSIPVTSVKNWGNYVNRVAATLQRPPWGVATRIRLVPDAKTQFRVVFELIEPLAGEYLPEIHNKIDLANNALLVPYEMNPEQEEAPAENEKY